MYVYIYIWRFPLRWRDPRNRFQYSNGPALFFGGTPHDLGTPRIVTIDISTIYPTLWYNYFDIPKTPMKLELCPPT